MARITKKEVKDFLKMEKERYGDVLKMYSNNTLVFSFLLGMNPSSCEGMYPESDMDEETLDMYDRVDNIIWDIRREGL